jgi:hypothetical protein
MGVEISIVRMLCFYPSLTLPLHGEGLMLLNFMITFNDRWNGQT